MKYFLPLLILTGLLFGQNVLHLKSGELYTGTFYGKVGKDIVFMVEGETSTKKFSINDVEIIKMKSGELSYPFDVPKIANDIPITNERQETLNYSVTDFDILILKSGTTYFGEYSKIEEEIVYFKPQNVFAFQPISIKQIQRLKLKDGHFIIGDGKNILTFSNINDEYQKEIIKDSEVIFYLFCSIAAVVFIVFIVKNINLGLDDWSSGVGSEDNLGLY